MSAAHDSKPGFSAVDHTAPLQLTAEGMLVAGLDTVKNHGIKRATANILAGYADDGRLTSFCNLSASDSAGWLAESWTITMKDSNADLWFMIQYAFSTADVTKFHLMNSCTIAAGYTDKRRGKPVGRIGLIRDGDFLPLPAKLTKVVRGTPHFTIECNELPF